MTIGTNQIITDNGNLIAIDIPVIDGYKYPTEDLIELKIVLDSWNIGCVYQTCIGKNKYNTYS